MIDTSTITNPQTLPVEAITQENLRNTLEQFAEQQKQQFIQHRPVTDLVLSRSTFIDKLLIRLWEHYGVNQYPDIALVAVGGYGRGELHPLSDVDILILSAQPLSDETGRIVSEFLTFLWDLRLEVGHSVRTIDDCIEIGSDDLTVATNLTEARILCGSNDAFQCLQERASMQVIFGRVKTFIGLN